MTQPSRIVAGAIRSRTVAPGPAAPRRRRIVLIASTFLLTSACSVLPSAPMDPVTLHMLDARPVVATAPRLDRVLAIGPVRAAPGAESTAMAYVRKPHALDHYATHRWADTPARMLDPLLVRALEDTGAFRAVVQTRAGVAADLRLDTEIVRLRQSFLAATSRIELSLRVQLLDVAGRHVLATRYLELAEEAPSDDAAGGVAAANAAVGRALAQVATFCVESSAILARRTTGRPDAGAADTKP